MDLEKTNILWKEMRSEVFAVQEWAHQDTESDLRKRVFIRSMASFVEACINSLSEAVVTQSAGLSAAERAILSETQFDVSENGMVKERKKFYPIMSRWQLLVRVMERKIGTDHWKVDFSNSEYTSFKSLFTIRNRITHPRTTGSMKIEFEEIETCIRGFTWFIDNYQGLCKINRSNKPL